MSRGTFSLGVLGMVACSQSRSVYPIVVLTLLEIALVGCANQPVQPAATSAPVQPSGATANIAPSVAHYSRYTLIEMSPDAAQSDLLQQVVDVRVPATASSSVGDALRYVLVHSGYRLCDEPIIRDLDGFPLPAAHMHLGPLTLASVLQLLVGPSWRLEIDESDRRVCFGRRESRSSTDRATDSGGYLPPEGSLPSTHDSHGEHE